MVGQAVVEPWQPEARNHNFNTQVSVSKERTRLAVEIEAADSSPMCATAHLDSFWRLAISSIVD